jgi:hypothetical protein
MPWVSRATAFEPDGSYVVQNGTPVNKPDARIGAQLVKESLRRRRPLPRRLAPYDARFRNTGSPRLLA